MNHVIPPDLPSAGADALKVLAYSNPNRGSGGDIGQDLIEGMPGLPGLLKSTGDSVLKKGADSHLWWEFGMEPLIDDLYKIYEYRQIFYQRLKEFNSLFMKGGLRRRINLGSYSATTEDASVGIQTNYFFVTARRVTTTKVKRWGVVRWYPYGWSLLDLADGELEGRLRRLLYGLDLSPESLWNKMPWTWLTNWFTTTGLWLKANKSNFAVKPGPVCIMTTYETTIEFKVLSKTSWISVSGSSIKHVTKERQVIPSGGIPFSFFRPNSDFGLGKSSILGSLAIQRLT
ncbi:MAG: putative maturation protein [Leviviridae sp.]|nr:MAG: putative maturation protein [Leviviridae sp.]